MFSPIRWFKKRFGMAAAPPLTDSPSPFLFVPLPSTSEVSHETVHNLRSKLLGHSDSVDHLGSIYVYSASLYKCKTGAAHEFLAFHIRDKDEQRQTVLLLDRVPHWEVETSPNPQDAASVDITIEEVQRASTADEAPPTPKRPLEVSGSSQNRSFSDVCAALFDGNSIAAADMFFISAIDNLAGLCAWRKFSSFEELERIDIGHQNLLIEQVIAVACAVSDHHPLYNLYRHQCYWYAGVIWDVICMVADTKPQVIQAGRGTARFARFISIAPKVAPEDGAQVMHQYYLQRWQEYRQEAELKSGRGKAAVARQRDEATTRAEVAEAARATTEAALAVSEARLEKVEAALDANAVEMAQMRAQMAAMQTRLRGTSAEPK
ncbi:hypothetical protein FRC08_015485 [Ceratobasidium sp. 394]|nr:hypothetical protein FRC08_015485 [Ceratobasidium sp. 394]